MMGSLYPDNVPMLDDLVTWKEGLLGSPGGCLCLPSSDFWLSPPTGCTCLLNISRLHSCPRLTEVAPSKWQDGLSQPCEPQPLSTLQEPGLSLLSLNTGPMGVGGSFCVLFFSTFGFLSDGEDNNDSRSVPGNRGGPASAECCRGEFPSS